MSSPKLRYVVCVRNGGYVDLELTKVYKVLGDKVAQADGLLRVVDNTGEDYLYPQDFFMPVSFSRRGIAILRELYRKLSV